MDWLNWSGQPGAFLTVEWYISRKETRGLAKKPPVDTKEDQAIFPWHSSGEEDVRVKGPCKMEPGHYFLIDGRDEGWPEVGL